MLSSRCCWIQVVEIPFLQVTGRITESHLNKLTFAVQPAVQTQPGGQIAQLPFRRIVPLLSLSIKEKSKAQTQR